MRATRATRAVLLACCRSGAVGGFASVLSQKAYADRSSKAVAARVLDGADAAATAAAEKSAALVSAVAPASTASAAVTAPVEPSAAKTVTEATTPAPTTTVASKLARLAPGLSA
jgi:hypothetical protein